MKKFFTLFVIFTSCLMTNRIFAESDTVSCAFFMYPKAAMGCPNYVSYGGNAPSSATFIWNFDGGIIISGSGMGPYYIQWNTTGIKTVLLHVIYNADSCSSSKTIHVVPPPLIYSVTGGGSYPSGGSGVHIGLSGSQLHASYFVYLNGNTTSVSNIPGTGSALDFGLFTTAGTYTCKAKLDSTSGSCMTNMHDSAVVTISGFVPSPYICMVTYDTVSHRNMVIWNKYPVYHIAHFNIYRQTYQEGVFTKIGESPFNHFTTFVDTTADPVVMAYKYELSATDSTGSESQLSLPHKTVHLEVSPGITGFNLIWNHYEGFDFHTYKIHRKLGTGPWQVIDSIASDNISYTDLYVSTGLAYYYIEVIRYAPCNPSLKSGIYESIVSNVGTSAPLGITENQSSSILVYPNPARQTLNIVIPGTDHASCRLVLLSMDGKKCIEKEISQSKTVLDISGLTTGLYILKAESDQSIVVKKIFKE